MNLSRTPFDLLVYLIRERHRVVTKDELLRAIWPGVTVEENALARHVSTLRRHLHDTRETGEYITTVHSQGYRFTADVHTADTGPGWLQAQESHEPSEAPATAGEPDDSGHDHSRRHIWTLGLGASLFALGVVIGLFMINDGIRSAEMTTGHLEPFSFGVFDRQPSWSPDETSVAFTSERSGNADIWTQPYDNTTGFQVTHSPAHDWQPAWSPDGRLIAFRSERAGGGIYVVAPTGDAERLVSNKGYLPRWAPSGRYLLLSESNPNSKPTHSLRLLSVNPAGDGPPKPALREMTATFRSGYATWYPRGERISIWGRRSDGSWAFLTAAIDGTEPVVQSVIPADVISDLDSERLQLEKFSWSSSGRHLYFEGESHGVRNIFCVDVDPGTMAWTTLRRLTFGPGDDVDIAVGPRSSRLAFSVQSRTTKVMEFAFDEQTGGITGEGRALTPADIDVHTFAVSSMAERVVYKTAVRGFEDLWTRPIALRNEERVLASSQSRVTKPRLSHDGSRLAYLRSAGPGATALAMMSLPDRTEKVLTASSKVALVPYDWSADGRSILVPCKDGNPKRSAACLVDAFGFPAGAAVPRVLFSSDTVHVEPQAFSPDERWIGINVSDAPTRPGVTALYAVRNDGSHWTPLTDNGSRHGKLRWSSDGQSIYYLSNEGGVVNVWGRRFDPKAGKPLGHKFQVTTFKSARRMVSPDMATVEIGILAGRLAVPIAESSSRLWTLQVTKD